VKGKQATFGFDLQESQTPFIVVFKGTIESATKMTGTVATPFCGSEGCKWTAKKRSEMTFDQTGA
jgi:hypothetical protein